MEKWVSALLPLVKSGKVRRVGVPNHNLGQIKRAKGVHIFAIRTHYSLLYHKHLWLMGKAGDIILFH